MNIQADPVGYKALSRHFAAARMSDQEVANEVRSQSGYLRIIAWSVGTLAVLALLAVLHQGKGIAMPIVLGTIVGLIFGPLGDRGARFGIPAPATILVSATLAAVALAGILYLVLPSVGQLEEAVPRIRSAVERLTNSGEQLVSVVQKVSGGAEGEAGVETKPEAKPEAKPSTVDLAAKVAAIVTPTIAEFVIFLFTLLLFTASRQEIRSWVVLRFPTRKKRLAAVRAFAEAESRLTDYMFTVAAINAGLAVVVGTALWLADVPGAPVWALLAFVLNFLPVVGPLLLKGALLAFGLVTYPTILSGLIPVAIYLAISLIEANAVTPRIIGSRITMNPLLVFLAVVGWTWLWGFAGAFVAMPLLAIVSVIRDQFAPKPAVSLPQ